MRTLANAEELLFMFTRERDFPKTVRIKDTEYDVVFFNRKDAHKHGMDEDWRGYACQHEKAILVRRGQDHQNRLATFVHEILHAIEFEYQVKIPHALIYKLEDPLTSLILDNLLTSGRVTW